MNIFAMFLVRWGHIHFLLLWVSTCFAQPALDLEKITIAQGLSQGFVSAICQDREGFLWFGTNNGLNRYDGYEFTVFRHDPYEPYSISHNEVKCIAEAGEFLYIATATGLDKYDKHSRRFYHLPVPDNPANLSPQKLLSDGRQTLWLLHTVSGRNVLHRMTIPAPSIHTDGKPADEGEVCIDLSSRPLALMDRYDGAPENNAEAMRDGFYHTGDVAHRDANGYITFVGRRDDVFKSSGYRISPFELESALIEHEAVVEVAVVPSPDPVRYEVPKAFVILTAAAQPGRALATALFAFLRTRLAPYKRIRRIEFVTELPKTISGKIRRVELRTRERQAHEGGLRNTSEYLDEEHEARP